MRGFSQAWNVEVEVKKGEKYDPDRHDTPDTTGPVRGEPASA